MRGRLPNELLVRERRFHSGIRSSTAVDLVTSPSKSSLDPSFYHNLGPPNFRIDGEQASQARSDRLQSSLGIASSTTPTK
ncbi:hypothetical protein TWF694_000523 [Orbilia ellipsospora]|uniref:Uncharacterized protein n=1 Tax=Orbilia ellipsospora TaxID=2528407 RepID=A0AAV9XQ94_9PEZI